jgi:hypothetical protein
MSDKPIHTWPHRKLSSLEILLDYQNPRIEAKEGISQRQIRLMLIENEEICELANEIVENNGLIPGERIIVINEDEKYIVLEGNRRTCAIQLLLDHTLIPASYKSKFPKYIPDILTRSLESIECVIAPSRESAEIVITKRHTEPGIKQWTPAAKQRRILKLIKDGWDIDYIAKLYGMSKNSVAKTLQEYNLIQYVKDLPGWKEWEKKELANPKLKITPYTRFFTLSNAKDRLKLKFNDKGDIQTTLDKKIFDNIIREIARELLIPNKETGKPSHNTRASAEDVFKSIAKRDTKIKAFFELPTKVVNIPIDRDGAEEKSGTEATSATPNIIVTTKRAAKYKFFENLENTIEDPFIPQVVYEISRINITTQPLAATFLLRALIERTLLYCIDAYKLRGQMFKEYLALYPANRGREPNLSFVLDFAIKNAESIFSLARVKSVIGHWKGMNDFMNMIIHCNWVVPHPEHLIKFASFTRPVIEQILKKEVLK